MSGDREDVSWERSKGLDERVLSTLEGLQGRIAFNGLRRVLHAHPESLTRSLRRLEREGRVERSAEGYRVVGAGPNGVAAGSPELRPIAHVELPPGAVSEAVLGRLSGRWFGSLRWVGVVDSARGRLLAWARRDGAGYVLLGVHRGILQVFVRGESSGDDDSETEDSAYELLTHAVASLRPGAAPSAGSVSFLSAPPDPALSLLEN
jgi:hypothetical protein